MNELEKNMIKSFEEARKKLLDMTMRNGLLNFKFSQQLSGPIRIVNHSINHIYSYLLQGKELHIKELPEVDNEPKDEKTKKFKEEYERAIASDEIYLSQLKELDDKDVFDPDEIARIQRELKDRIREQLGLPERVNKTYTPIAWAREIGINPDYENILCKEKLYNNELQTLDFADDLGKKTKALYRKVNEDVTGKGVNTLYIALGFLEWYETKTSETKHYAPLLLLRLNPKKLNNKTGKSYVSVEDNVLQFNVSLAIKFNEFNMKLPDFTGEDTPETYLDKVEKAIISKPRWKVRRYVTIGRFVFSRIAMYQDLDLSKWKNIGKILSSSDISRIFKSNTSFSSDSHQYDIDKEKESTNSILVSPADTSQHSAIIDSNRNESMVIQGPPGTGKSQTITNLIANALNKGKKVLFVSEKLAALNVVYERLKKAKLGDFCLELHSDKATMKKLQPSLANSFNEYIAKNGNILQVDENKINELNSKKCKLRDYYDFLNKKIGAIDITVNDAIWREKETEEKIKNVSPYLIDVKLTDTDKISINKYNEILDTLNNLSIAQKNYCESIELTRDKQHFEFKDILSSEVNNLFNQIIQLKTVISNDYEKFKNLTNDIITIDEATIENIVEMNDILLKANEMSNNLKIDYNLLPFLNSEDRISKINTIIENIEKYSEKHTELKTKVLDTTLYENIKEIEQLCKNILNYSQKCSDYTIEQLNELISKIEKWNSNIDVFQYAIQTILDSDNIDVKRIILANEILSRVSKVDSSAFNYMNDYDVVSPGNTEKLQNILANIEKKQKIKEELNVIKNIDKLNDIEIIEAYNVIKDASFINKFSFKYLKQKKKIDSIFTNKIKYNKQFAYLDKLLEYFDINGKIYKESFCKKYLEENENSIYAMLQANILYQDLHTIKFNPIASDIAEYNNFIKNIDVAKLHNLKMCLASYNYTEIDYSIISEMYSECETKEQYKDKCVNITSDLSSYIKYVSNKIVLELTISDLIKYLMDYKENVKLRLNINQDIQQLGSKEIALKLKDKKGIIETRNTNDYAECIYKLDILPDVKNKLFETNGKLFLSELKNVIDEVFKITNDIKTRISKINSSVRIRFVDYVPSSKSLYNIPIEKYFQIIDDLLCLKNYVFCKCSLEIQKENILNSEVCELIKVLDNQDIKYKQITDYFNYVFYKSLIEEYASKDWNNFQPEQYRVICDKVRKLDEEIYEEYQNLLLRNIINNINENKNNPIVVGNDSIKVSEKTGISMLSHIIKPNVQGRPIREIIEKSAKAIQLMKPCFLMSPISVAQYLVPEKIEFDLLIIDEASQMYFEEAIGSLLRCKKYIVVGDEKQLPPTSFFQKTVNILDDFEEEIDGGMSILEMCQQRSFNNRELLWHYRSKDDTLINFSNHHFYNDNLNIFPSVISPEDKKKYESGVELHYIKDGLYKSGKKQNLREAEEIRKAVQKFVVSNPDKSLGIVTMNSSQQGLVEQEIDILIEKDPNVRKYYEHWSEKQEGLFVKNLENVQGDERDYIFISTVYGPETIGGKVAQRFGPINGIYGHRRLNVLITRAKYGIKLFTSMKSSDIVETQSSSQGVSVFRQYLAYAETGKLELGQVSNRTPESPFEVAVKRVLESKGFIVDAQVGCKGFFIDLAVKHKKNTSIYAVGIECDGAPYHSSKSARDRDCIRQQILEKAGWNIYRIWSTDWYHNTDRETEKLLDYVNEMMEKSPKIKEREQKFDKAELDEILSTPVQAELFEVEDNDIVEKDVDDERIVEVGDTVECEQDGKFVSYKIVSGDSDANKGIVNEFTPVARALLDCVEGDETYIELPNNTSSVIIKRIIKA